MSIDSGHIGLWRSMSLDRFAGDQFAGDQFAGGQFTALLHRSPALEIGPPGAPAAESGSYAVVFAGYRLQDLANYRAAIQDWFDKVRPGGHLVIVVPHAFLYERQDTLPSRWRPAQRRLYTPRSLMEEIEESLAPNSYRVRCLCDCDAEYDYTLDSGTPPEGQHDVIVALEKISQPAWRLSERAGPVKADPTDAFEPARTRVEATSRAPSLRVLILKLDHLGDFIMGMPALDAARKAFPGADITLVVGSWNLAAARDMMLFEHVIAFDAFPRNAAEEKPDVRGKASEFAELITSEYDLAIDLRTDHDTRYLLDGVRARIKAGIGTRSQYGFLDIFLPIDHTRHTQVAWQREISPQAWLARTSCSRNRHQIASDVPLAPDSGAMIWGPYHHLPAGHYLFEPFVEFVWKRPALIRYDLALEQDLLFQETLSQGGTKPIAFFNPVENGRFEFRFWGIAHERLPAFQFYGGRLIKQGSTSVLHQSEYLSLLIELVAMRVSRSGVLREWDMRP